MTCEGAIGGFAAADGGPPWPQQPPQSSPATQAAGRMEVRQCRSGRRHVDEGLYKGGGAGPCAARSGPAKGQRGRPQPLGGTECSGELWMRRKVEAGLRQALAHAAAF
eukprot:CAMPEP_0174344450 /NCGR_PEP_ID=MMETSP0810-20121108/27667_1 /TAXON_ID=73025 ORGANISM="Eutreptiella gymnastica-like, Strain CCMP1594" /NCGR_SAMPLE_ID=MMETSP0810 /ASSEMBLY_ACC=CAM_ASM_000659 /LENGTH=107 /DNA_ID=CAMNT_0015467585 /DNA_START=410 /DNA_END=732 /DNA_ORIENTATION=-